MKQGNILRTPAYMATRNVIRSCQHLEHWEVANQMVRNYEARYGKEFGLHVELTNKLNTIQK